MMYIKYIAAFLASVHFLVFQVSYAAQATSSDFSPPETPEKIPEGGTLSESPLKTIALGRLIIRLEKTTLKDVLDTIGAGVIHHRGDAGRSTDFLCYSGNSAGHIWIASGELGGDENFVTTLYANTDTELKSSADCPELPSQFHPMTINDSLWTGSSVSQLKKHLGAPTAEKEDWMFYCYLGKVMVNNVEMDRLTVLSVRINGGKVVTLVASRATTN